MAFLTQETYQQRDVLFLWKKDGLYLVKSAKILDLKTIFWPVALWQIQGKTYKAATTTAGCLVEAAKRFESLIDMLFFCMLDYVKVVNMDAGEASKSSQYLSAGHP